MIRTLLIIIISTFLFASVSCEKEGTAEKAGKEADKAGKALKDSAEKAGEALKDTAEKK